EKERQRLESLRKKQEAEEQRKKKVEEERRRRQAEMKQKREERLRKALQARERVEQMEEEKKKRMEQKILQNEEKVRMREEKVAEEWSKKKLLKKHGEADARKQKVPSVVRATLGPSCMVFFFLLQEEDEFEQQKPLQKRKEDEVKEKGRKVLELKNLVGQQQVEQVKESTGATCWKIKCFILEKMLEMATGWQHITRRQCRCSLASRQAVCSPEACLSWSCLNLATEEVESCSKSRTGVLPLPVNSLVLRVTGCSSSAQLLRVATHVRALENENQICCENCEGGTKESRSPKVNENNYGMDLNSDDSTDDENEPRKPVPAWADGSQLNQAILHQYYHPVNVDQLFGLIPSPKLEDIFGKSKPRYFKRTSSAVWHSPP
ncbi:INCE protein, partial [Spizaetus tyrannus]|nr:INCE protein [Spizaetus tyrannus]